MAPKTAARGEYIETETGNKISRRASILGPKHIILAGKCVIQHDVIVHGDLVRAGSQAKSVSASSASAAAGGKPESKAASTSSAQDSVSVHLGRYVFVSAHVTLHPPSRLASSTNPSSSSSSSSSATTSTTPAAPVQSLTYYPLRIGDHVFIGPHTHVQAAQIGSHVHIGARCVVGNLVIIKDNVRVEDGTVLAPHSHWASGSVVAGRPGRVVGEVGDGWAATEGGPGGGGAGRARWEAVGKGAR